MGLPTLRNRESIELTYYKGKRVERIERVECPYCKSTSNDRIPRGWFVKNVLFWIPVNHYLCHKCFMKHYRRRDHKRKVKSGKIRFSLIIFIKIFLLSPRKNF